MAMKRYIYISIILLILLLSAYFRLGFPDITNFRGDEDDIASKFLDFVTCHNIPPLLIETRGTFTVSLFDKFIYFIMLFFRDPRIIILLGIAVPNTLAVIFCFLFCHRFVDKRVAIVATALFGFSNWAILYSGNLWCVDVLQLFSILTFYVLALGIYRARLGIIILAILLLVHLPNLHLTGLSIVLSVFLILLIYYSKMNMRHISIIGALLFIPVAALVIYTKGLGLRARVITDNISLSALFTTINLIVRGEWYYGYMGVSPRYPAIENYNDIFIKIVFLFGCVYILRRIVQDWRLKCFSGYSIVGFWYFVFIFAFSPTELTPHGHYFMAVFPSLFIIIAVGFFSIIDYISGKEKISQIEILLLLSIFIFWYPKWTILAVSAILLLKWFPRNIVRYALYLFVIFILIFQPVSNLQLFSEIERNRGVPGIPGLDLGAKIESVKYVIEDAEARYIQTGLRSYYSVENGEGYGYLFKYLRTPDKAFISGDKIDKGYHYTIIGDPRRSISVEGTKNYLSHRRIGPILVVVEEIR